MKTLYIKGDLDRIRKDCAAIAESFSTLCNQPMVLRHGKPWETIDIFNLMTLTPQATAEAIKEVVEKVVPRFDEFLQAYATQFCKKGEGAITKDRSAMNLLYGRIALAGPPSRDFLAKIAASSGEDIQALTSAVRVAEQGLANRGGSILKELQDEMDKKTGSARSQLF